MFTSRCLLSKQKMAHYTNTDSDALGKVGFETGHTKYIEWAGKSLPSEAWKTCRVGSADSVCRWRFWSQRSQEFSELHVCLCHVMLRGPCDPQQDTWQVYAYNLYHIAKKICFKWCLKRRIVTLWINSNRVFKKNTYITNHKTQPAKHFVPTRKKILTLH